MHHKRADAEQVEGTEEHGCTKVPNGGTITAGRVSAKIVGELVPIVELTLPQGESVYFEHHTILAKDPAVNIGVKKMKSGLGKRLIAGLPLIQVEAEGPGKVSLSRDGVGEVVVLKMDGHEVDVQQHHFLFASATVNYDYTRLKGWKNIFGGAATTYFMDQFSGHGLLALHGYGNVVVRQLSAHEEVDIEPSAWLFKDSSVTMNTHGIKLSSGLLGGSYLWMTRFTGPGRVAYMSYTLPMGVIEGA